MESKTADFIVPHPDYDPKTGLNDIAIIILPKKSEFTFDEKVNKIELPTASPTVDTVGELSGFGFTSPDGNAASDDLYLVKLKVVEAEDCNAFYRRVMEKRFCAAPSDSISNVCSGDHGSGLVAPPAAETPGPDPEEPPIDAKATGDVLVGIASLISPICDTKVVSGYTDVFEYIGWIEDIIT